MDFSFDKYSGEFRKCIELTAGNYVELINDLTGSATSNFLKAMWIGKISKDSEVISSYYQLIDKLRVCCEKHNVDFISFINPIYIGIRTIQYEAGFKKL